MHSYIAIQNTYDVFEMALFINNQLVDRLREDKRYTSKLFIPLLGQVCTKNNIMLSDLSFCAVNCGPGPFSTLRSIIASVNGLHLATDVPLIGIDGLDATFLEYYDNSYANTVVLFNAFNNEVYYLIAHQDKILAKGYQKIDLFLKQISSLCARPELVEGCPRALEETFQQINFIGNGVEDLIKEICGNNAIIKENNPSMCSVEMIGRLGLDTFMSEQKTNGYVMPLHLKKHAVEL